MTTVPSGTGAAPRPPLRLVVAEDDVLLREGMRRLLVDSGFDVVAQAGDADDLLRKALAHRPDVSIVDVQMPPHRGDDGLVAAMELRRRLPASGVLVLSQFYEPSYALDLIGESAEGVGYLLKDRVGDVATFLSAIERVASGGTALDSEVVGRMLGRRPLHRRGADGQRGRGGEALHRHLPQARHRDDEHGAPARARRADVPGGRRPPAVTSSAAPMAERMVEVNGVELCTEAFGDAADAPVLLVMGLGASMLWWEEGFCRALADGGRFVIRYDHRDTGRSVTSEPGRPDYTSAELVADAVGILDAYAIPSAHVVGVSAGAALAQRIAIDHPRRVASLVLISTSPALPVPRALPPPTEALGRFFATAAVDWSDAGSVVDHLVGYSRVLAGGRRPFAEAPTRSLVRRDVERARDFAAVQNHDVLAEGAPVGGTLSSIAAPTLVIHGTADPMFPIEHGEALAEAIPGARLLRLDDAGHGVERADRETIAGAILAHTAAGGA
jgi:pimeloyl-ACP methyl ester carboxylesterase/DNA-binding NarL/FixJ family response regulator